MGDRYDLRNTTPSTLMHVRNVGCFFETCPRNTGLSPIAERLWGIKETSIDKIDRIDTVDCSPSQANQLFWVVPSILNLVAMLGWILFSLVWPRLSQIKRPEILWAVWVFGILAGLLVALLLVMFGWMVELLLIGQHEPMPDRLAVGGQFVIETRWLNAGGSVLRGVMGLLALIVVVTLLETIALLANYRVALNTSLDFAVDIQRHLYRKSGALAVQQGLSGQQTALREHLQVHIPKVRDALHQWYRAFPRHLIQCVALSLLACTVQPWFTILAAICLLILWTLFGLLDTAKRKRRPVFVERARTANVQLAYFCETAPLLASIHPHEETELGFESQLHNYRQTQIQLSEVGVWKSPAMIVTAVAMSVLLTLVLAIRFLDTPPRALRMGESITMCLAVTLAIVSLLRLIQCYRKYRAAESAVNKLANYLDQPTHTKPDTESLAPTAIREQLTLEHVSFRDSSGQKLLEDISLQLKPGQLTSIVASELVQAKALAELILGFGRPASGRILIDQTDSSDIDPDAFRRLSLWIAPNGPLISGTIEANLRTSWPNDATVDLMAIAKRAHVSEAILNLVDGLSTLVTPTDDRLQPDQLFRLGVTRGLVKKPSLVVANEPSASVRPTTEGDTLDALQQLKQLNAIVVVLPNRLATLRASDKIVVINDHRIDGVGTHSELLESSEIYRHLNYMRFSSPDHKTQ
jgi:ATP-binding cassette, subfamily B, bacterial